MTRHWKSHVAAVRLLRRRIVVTTSICAGSQIQAIEVPRPAPSGAPRSADRRRGQPSIGGGM
jgi:hypothetical protein